MLHLYCAIAKTFLHQFLSLLENEALFFPSLSILEDKFEGSFEAVLRSYKPKLTDEKINRYKLNLDQRWPEKDRKRAKEIAAISCWHMSDEENVAMWKIYALRGQEIAIQTTFERLDNSLLYVSDETEFWASEVFYDGTPFKRTIYPTAYDHFFSRETLKCAPEFGHRR